MVNKKVIQNDKLICTCCGKEKNDRDFYISSSPIHKHTGKLSVCKTCIWELAEVNEKSTDMRNIKDLLRSIDKPFITFLWDSSVEEGTNTNKFIFKIYMKNLGMPQYKSLNWDDSDFNVSSESTQSVGKNNKEFFADDYVIDKWGVGYTPQEYEAFERKYNVLKNNYQEKTSMHTEALLTFIRYRVKEELATARGDVKEAKEWGTLASKQAQDAKINPSQLSKADLSDGLDTFGQLVRTVEQSVDIIPLLPQFKERPHDKPDFAMWCYINYIRDLKGLPLAEYDEIYRFYDDRKKEYENRFEFLQDGDDES